MPDIGRGGKCESEAGSNLLKIGFSTDLLSYLRKAVFFWLIYAVFRVCRIDILLKAIFGMAFTGVKPKTEKGMPIFPVFG